MFALINARIFDLCNYFDNGYIVFNEKIIETGNMEAFTDRGYDIVDCKGHLVMPSLTVAHTHIYSTFARGIDMEFNPTNFQEILDQLWWKLDSHLESDDIYFSGLTAASEYAKNGVTAVIDHHAGGAVAGSLDLLKKSFEEIGIRGLFCFETSDRFNVDECIAENIKSGDMFGLHASMSLSDKTLEKVSKALGNKPIHIHVAESWLDQENCLSFHGERVINRLDRFGLLHKNSILSHCIHINEAEADIIAERECAIALNITSNMNNAVGLPDYRMFADKGIRCLIGNDGMSMGITGEWLSLYLAMKHKYLSPTAFGLLDLLYIIDNNNNYINDAMGIRIGRLEKDCDADILMIPYNPPTPIHACNTFGHIIFGLASNFKPNNVWCGGKLIVEDYKNVSISPEKIALARKTAEKLWSRISGSDKNE